MKIKLTKEQRKQMQDAYERKELIEFEIFVPEPEKVELEGGEWWMNTVGDLGNCVSDLQSRNFGVERSTEEAVKLARDRMIRVNRLSALAHQLNGERESIKGKYTHYIYKYKGDWVASSILNVYHPERVYMTESCAKEICELLNTGIFSLGYEE